MKIQKTVLALVCLLACNLTACSQADEIITVDRLPKVAQEFITTHFADSEVSYCKKDYEGASYTYEVKFTNGYDLEFAKNGEWLDVDCNHQAVPEAIVPAAILSYVQAHFANCFIVEIQREARTYEVELNNDVQLVFDKNGNFKRIDD